MTMSILTVKGQIVVPAKIRQRLGLKKGSRVAIMEQENGFTVQPIDKKYFTQFAGIFKTKGELTRTLLEERRKERELEDRRIG